MLRSPCWIQVWLTCCRCWGITHTCEQSEGFLWRDWFFFFGVIYPFVICSINQNLDCITGNIYPIWGLALFRDKFQRGLQGGELLGKRCKDDVCRNLATIAFPSTVLFYWDNILPPAPGAHHCDPPIPSTACGMGLWYSVLDGPMRFLLLRNYNCDNESLSQLDDYGCLDWKVVYSQHWSRLQGSSVFQLQLHGVERAGLQRKAEWHSNAAKKGLEIIEHFWVLTGGNASCSKIQWFNCCLLAI